MKKKKTNISKVAWSKTNIVNNNICKKDEELITFLLSSLLSQEQLPLVVQKLLSEFNNLNDILHADKVKLLSLEGIGESVYYTFASLREFLSRTLNQPIINKNIINCWEKLLNYLKFTMGSLRIEHFRVLFLNFKNVLLADELLATGTVSHAPVYAREIFRRALFHDASAIVLIHNHPSGDPTPSAKDISYTLKIIDACKVIDVKVLDHIIIAENKYFSFNEVFETGGDISCFNINMKKMILAKKVQNLGKDIIMRKRHNHL